MKYCIGYQVNKTKEFTEFIIKNKAFVNEVYFAWADFPNGRNIQIINENMTPWEVENRTLEDISLFYNNGIPINLLFNATCYGKDSLSRVFYSKIGETIDYFYRKFSLSSVTTTYPLIAKFIKNNFGDIKTRASVNMEIGTVRGMDYLSEYFDGYYMKREFNRDFDRIEVLKKWCDDNGKTLHILANSGCLNDCSAHTFHDNLVAHENEISKMDNCFEFKGICHEYLKNAEKRYSLIRDTSFIRPEDVKYYEQYFDSMKLATRISNTPIKILDCYIKQKCIGNILEILEPNHAARIYPNVLDNTKLNNDYLFCNKDCSSCNKCYQNYEKALFDLSKIIT